MKILKLLCLLGFCLLLGAQACRKDEAPIPVKEFPAVEESLWPYFERFEVEAARRGLEIDLIERGITAKIEAIAGEHVGGLCNYHADDANEIVVDDFIWANTSEFQKEIILFHELGHCYLFREHRDDAFDDGFCKSLMRSGLSDCIDHYNGNTRSQYLDELFDPDSF